jgi:UDP-N-acetylmuramate: L-alanyl-gamma-D-glutamyl-meso-diaminopimelate ligase
MKIHLTAICGTGMGSFAGILQRAGHEVRGSDENIYPPMSDKLREWGIPMYEGFQPENLNWNPDLVIIGNVVTRKNPEGQAILARGLAYESFPSAMGRMFLEGRRSIVVAGTHGKTTTSAMIAWLLHEAGQQPGFLIGGALRNFPESFRDTPPGHPFVIEGDEYDTAFFDKGPKFLHYRPRTAIVTSIEHDHADIYANVEAVAESFRKLARIMPSDGLLLLAKGAPGETYLDELAKLAPCRVERYGLGADTGSEWRGEIEHQGPDGLSLRLWHHAEDLGVFRLSVPGRHNAANAIAALAASLQNGAAPDDLRRALPGFLGARRRQEEAGTAGDVLVIDDFAHHPTAVHETLRALRSKYPNRRFWALFEPRSATCRRNILEPLYVEAFDLADEVIIAHAHRSEEFPLAERFLPGRLAENLTQRGVRARYLPDAEQIVSCVASEAHAGDVVVVMSNGSFGGIVPKLLAALRARGSHG